MSLYYCFPDLLEIDFSQGGLEQPNHTSNTENTEPDKTSNIIQMEEILAQQETPISGPTTASISDQTTIDDLLLDLDELTTAQEARVTPVLSSQLDTLTEVFGPTPHYEPSPDPFADFMKSHNEVTKRSIKSNENVRVLASPSSSDVTESRTTKTPATVFDDLLARHGLSRTVYIPEPLKTMRIAHISTDSLHQKIVHWTSGKETNIRALLCSLHEILWDGGDRWTRPSIYELIEPSHVKKWYKKACLVVHPDKHVGTENELLAKSVFTQLNVAWANQESM